MTPAAKSRILFVDDEPDMLSALVRSLRMGPFDIKTATSGAAALELLANKGPFEVMIADFRMPEMDGIELFEKAREVSPDTIRVLFTGQPDVECAVSAVNRGAIFRFITKPCPLLMMSMTLRAAVDQHRLVTAERVLLEQTVRGSIKALMDVLALSSPLAFGRATRLRQAVAALASAAGRPPNWQLEVAAMLSQIGCVILPPPTLERLHQGEPLDSAEEAMLARMPGLVEQIVKHIPRLEPVLEILRFQHKRFDGSGPPDEEISGENIPWESRAMAICLALDTLESQNLPMKLAFDTLRGRAGFYDPELLETLATLRKSRHEWEVRELPVPKLRPGMVLAQDVRTKKGLLVITRGQEVTASLIEKLANFAPGVLFDQAIRVVVQENPPIAPAKTGT